MSRFHLTQFASRYLLVGSSHLFSLLVPIILLPLLISRIGSEAVGSIILIQTIATYILVFTEYDFNVWGARSIANNKSSDNELSNVISAKIFLLIVSAPILLIGSRVYFNGDEGWLFGIGGIIILLGYALSLNWFYQAKEKFGTVSFLNFISKIFYIAAVYFFIRSDDDVWLVNIFFGLGLIIANIYFLIGKVKLRFEIPDLSRGFDYFISNGLLQVFTNTSVLWISILLSVESITLFSSAERLVFVARGGLAVYATIIFPSLCREKTWEISRSTLFVHFFVCLFFLLFSFVIFFGADKISSWMLREVNSEAIHILRILSPVPMLIALNVLSNQWLIAQGFYKTVRNIYASVAVLSITLLPLGTYLLGLKGAAMVTVLLEASISIGLIWAQIKQLKSQRLKAVSS